MAKVFKSLWFKCAAVLMAITVVASGLLAVLNDVLYVDTNERTARAIKKIYGNEVEYSVVYEYDENGTEQPKYEYDFGIITKIYSIKGENGNTDLLFKTTGYNGYKNGTITLWVKVVKNADAQVIDKVLLESFEKQTLMSKLGDTYYGTFYKDITEAYNQGKAFQTVNEDEFYNPVSGATKSATAGNNAVNCVLKYLGEANV